MKFLNFSHGELPQAGGLSGLGREWDLHNGARFTGYQFDVKQRRLVLVWELSGEERRDDHICGCKLTFRGVDLFTVTERDPELPPSEDETLFGISRLERGQDKSSGFRTDWNSDEDFNLLFEFQSGVDLEVHAAEVEMSVLRPE
ncbi:hypothetical protein MRY87_06485 [bacterium]|nr:hypothetical protein [bacterium]